MDEQTYMDFTTTLGEEYCEVISPLCEHGAEPHDGYEVFGKAFGYDDITPERLHAAQVSNAELTRIRDIASGWAGASAGGSAGVMNGCAGPETRNGSPKTMPIDRTNPRLLQLSQIMRTPKPATTKTDAKSARLKNVLRAKNGTLIFLGSPTLHYVVPCCEGFAEDTLCLQVSRSHLCRNLN